MNEFNKLLKSLEVDRSSEVEDVREFVSPEYEDLGDDPSVELQSHANELEKQIRDFPAAADLADLLAQINQDRSSSRRWMAMLYRGGHSTAVPQLKNWLRTAISSLQSFQELHHDLKARSILRKLLSTGGIPWPRLMISMPMLEGKSPDQITEFNIVDTPGLDELCLLPELSDTLDVTLRACQAVVCVCNASTSGTDAWKSVTDLVDIAKEAATPVLMLANRIPPNASKAEKKELLQSIASDVWRSPMQVNNREGIFAVNVLGAYLSASLTELNKSGRFVQVLKSMYEKHKAE